MAELDRFNGFQVCVGGPFWKMAASFRFCDFWIQHVSISLWLGVHTIQVIKADIQPYFDTCSFGIVKWGKKAPFWGKKPPFLGVFVIFHF